MGDLISRVGAPGPVPRVDATPAAERRPTERPTAVVDAGDTGDTRDAATRRTVADVQTGVDRIAQAERDEARLALVETRLREALGMLDAGDDARRASRSRTKPVDSDTAAQRIKEAIDEIEKLRAEIAVGRDGDAAGVLALSGAIIGLHSAGLRIEDSAASVAAADHMRSVILANVKGAARAHEAATKHIVEAAVGD